MVYLYDGGYLAAKFTLLQTAAHVCSPGLQPRSTTHTSLVPRDAAPVLA